MTHRLTLATAFFSHCSTASSPTAAAPTSAPPPPWGAAVPDAEEAKAPVNDAGTHNGGGLLACVLLLLTYLAW